jgi:peptide/nickel transport system permease protein
VTSLAGRPGLAQAAIAAATQRILRRTHREQRWALWLLVTGGSVLAVVLLLSLVRPWLGLPSPYHQDFAHIAAAPSPAHPFGTDSLGRDVFARTLAAAPLDLGVAGAVTLASVLIGFIFGALAGFFGGALDALIMRFADVCLAFPFIVLVLVIIAATGPGLKGVLIGVPLAGWALYARLTRSAMLGVREREWVLASRTLGLPVRRTFLRHALPHVWRPAVAFSTADFVLNIMVLATLSYLGVGAQPPQPEWGALIADGQAQLLSAWWISTLPGVFVVVVGLAIAMLGDGLAERFGTEMKVIA